MYVINDKNPGKLIIVMAGAKGISGRPVTVIYLTFTAVGTFLGEKTTSISIDEVQLINSHSKEIKCVVRAAN